MVVDRLISTDVENPVEKCLDASGVMGLAMKRLNSDSPTDLELQLLKILWDDAPQTARQIREAMSNVGRELAHTSIITTLQKMVDKGQLRQLEPVVGKAFRFEPLVSEQSVSHGMLGDLVDKVFDGSAEAVMLGLFDVSDLDAEDLKRLRRLFNQKMREQQQ